VPNQTFADITRRVDILQRVMALISGGLELEPLLSKFLRVVFFWKSAFTLAIQPGYNIFI